MTEKQFIEQNKEKWRELEELLLKSDKDANLLQELFIKVSSDLSYARTFFPNRSVRVYLNNLTQNVFDLIRKKESKLGFEEIKHFFKHILPLEIYRSRKVLIISFLVFMLSVGIGVFSTYQNPEFAATILGESYVEMTEENINNGDPMAVYKDSGEIDMFFGITLNNIKVAFLAFVLGFFGSIGTIFVLASNGIMVGAFQYFFHTKGLFLTSFLTIWIHGTIEISAIIIAGAAGLILGNGILFPKTYDRTISLQIASTRALRILLGTVPLFILAGVLESFVTRLTELPLIVKVLIIGGSAAFVLFMWVLYPAYYARRNIDQIKDLEIIPSHQNQFSFKRFEYRDFGQNLILTLAQTRMFIPIWFKYMLIPIVLIFGFVFWLQTSVIDFSSIEFESISLFKYTFSSLPYLLIFALFWTVFQSILVLKYHDKALKDILGFLKPNFVSLFVVHLLWLLPFYFVESINLVAVIYLLISFQFPVVYICYLMESNEDGFINKLQSAIKLNYRNYFNYLFSIIIIYAVFYILGVLSNSALSDLFAQLIQWHELFDNYSKTNLFAEHLFMLIILVFLMPFYFYLIANQYYALRCKNEAIDLKTRLENFGEGSSILESL